MQNTASSAFQRPFLDSEHGRSSIHSPQLKLAAPRSYRRDDPSSRERLTDSLSQFDELAHVDAKTYAALLRQCTDAKALVEGRQLHARIAEGGYRQTTYLNNLLIQMYGRCGCVEDARKVFDLIAGKNVYSWNIMITAYAQNGHLQEARSLFEMTPQRTLVSWNSMLAAYTFNGQLQAANSMFESMDQRDVVSWNTMLGAYAQNGHGKEAFKLFQTMDMEGVLPNEVSFINVLDACGTIGDLALGQLVHASAVFRGCQLDPVVGTALVSMYCKCGSVSDAKIVFDRLAPWRVNVVTRNALLSAYTQNDLLEEAKSMFDAMPERDHVSWSIMILACAKDGYGRRAFKLFQEMDLEGVAPDRVTFSSVLDACGSLAALEEGKIVHSCVVDMGLMGEVVVATAIVSMYGKCGSLEEARKAFDGIQQRDVVAWNAMVAAYAQNGYGKEALEIFREMDVEGVKPNESTFVSIIDACTSTTARAEGKLIHALIADSGFRLEGGKVWNALVNMYGKGGELSRARRMFNKLSLSREDVVPWNAMIGSYAQFGHAQDALELFQLMLVYGVSPTQLTFLSVLSACSHAGLLQEARLQFKSMSEDCGLEAIGEHYHCMIDVLGRAGRLLDAHSLVTSMPFEPAAEAWSALISACHVHGDLKTGTQIANQVVDVAPTDSGLYVVLANIFAAAGMKDEVARVHKSMEEMGMKKKATERLVCVD